MNMKKIVLTVAAVMSMTMAFAAGENDNNNTTTNANAYKFNVSTYALSRALNLNYAQVDVVEDIVSQALGVLTRIYAAELRYEKNSISKTWRKPVEQGKQIYRLGKC